MIGKYYDIEPCTAPRQTQRDKWGPARGPIARYRRFRDEVWLHKVTLHRDFFHVVFFMPVPSSWPATKKLDNLGRPHTTRPDADNLVKALVDGVYRNREDGHVWNYAVMKLWGAKGGFFIADEFIPWRDVLRTLEDAAALVGARPPGADGADGADGVLHG